MAPRIVIHSGRESCASVAGKKRITITNPKHRLPPHRCDRTEDDEMRMLTIAHP